MDGFWAAPPVSRFVRGFPCDRHPCPLNPYGYHRFLTLISRTLTALTVLTSVAVYGGVLDGRRVIFYIPWILKFPSPEIWRFFTSFWLTGSGLGVLFDSYFCESTLGRRMLEREVLIPVASMDLFKCSGEGVSKILSAWGLFHLHYPPGASYHSEYYENFMQSFFLFFSPLS